MTNIRLNIDENIFYLHEKLKTLEKCIDFKLHFDFFKQNITDTIIFLHSTICEIEETLPKEFKNGNSIKNLRNVMKFKIDLKESSQHLILENSRINFDDNQLIALEKIINDIDTSIENIISIMEKNKEHMNQNSCLSNAEINLLLADFN